MESINFGISLVGGVISLILGIFIPWIFPEFYLFGEIFVLVFQTILVIGGSITILGTILYAFDVSNAIVFIAIGALLGGMNIITMFGVKQMREESNRAVKEKWLSQRFGGNTEEDKIRWIKEQYEKGRTLREIAEELEEPMPTVKYYIDFDLDGKN